MIGIARRAVDLGVERYVHVMTDLSDVAAAKHSIESEIPLRLRERAWTRLALVNNAASPDLVGVGERVDPEALLRVYAVNAVMPLWLMGLLARERPDDVPLRIVNVSSGAATRAVPGLAAYGSSKAALRMGAMVLMAEWQSTAPHAPTRRNVAVRVYEPGVVETDMQRQARAMPTASMPWVGMFKDFVTRGQVVEPEVPAAEIVHFLESDEPAYSEGRLGGAK